MALALKIFLAMLAAGLARLKIQFAVEPFRFFITLRDQSEANLHFLPVSLFIFY